MDSVLEDAEALLLSIPTLSGYWVGRPVPKSSTNQYTVDADYGLGMVFTFASPKHLQEFQEHPDFLKFQMQHGKDLKGRVIDFSPYVGAAAPPAP